MTKTAIGNLFAKELVSIPDKNSADNVRAHDVLGNKTDESYSGGSHTPSVMGWLRSMYYHVHGKSFTIPANAPVEIAPGGTTAYVYGTPVLVGTYATTTFDIHWVQVSDIGNNGYYNIELCNIDASVIYGKTSCLRTNNFTQEGNVPIQIPPLPKNTAVYARLGYSGTNVAHTVKVKLFAHPYADLT